MGAVWGGLGGEDGGRQQQGCKINRRIKKQRGKVDAVQWHWYMNLKGTTLFIQRIFTHACLSAFVFPGSPVINIVPMMSKRNVTDGCIFAFIHLTLEERQTKSP